jgi:hypothetical protein
MMPRLGARARMTLLDLYYAAVDVMRLSRVLVGSLIIFVGMVRATLDPPAEWGTLVVSLVG